MEKTPALDPMPLYESCMVAFYRGVPASGAPVVPTPLFSLLKSTQNHRDPFFLGTRTTRLAHGIADGCLQSIQIIRKVQHILQSLVALRGIGQGFNTCTCTAEWNAPPLFRLCFCHRLILSGNIAQTSYS